MRSSVGRRLWRIPYESHQDSVWTIVLLGKVTEWTLRLAGRDRGATKACETWPSESGAEMAAG